MPVTVQVKECSPELLAQRKAVNAHLEQMTGSQINWTQAPSAAEYRKWRNEGLNGFPKPFVLPEASTITIHSSHGDHSIPLRVLTPATEAKGVLLHVHGGGFVIGSSAGHDKYLKQFADDLSLVVISVEYRLAPENIFPAACHDVADAILFALSEEGTTQLGGPLRVISGESAGAYLAMWAAIDLRNQEIDVREKIAALALCYGVYDMSTTPSVKSHTRNIFINAEDTVSFTNAFIPPDQFPTSRLKSAEVSPLYADLRDLPPALFLVGTEDPLLDDSVFMASKYSLANNDVKLSILREAGHAFNLVPNIEMAKEGNQEILDFVRQHLE
ncbi:hypothetical protein N7457_000463 [Penicillium paradoxum]|uniref:uncharacterized protein n=1 Tax=Penicillium paradoxum TaxID=176176 RepID=UPI00254674F5|nr:uncharacterized protein N7457_000463 [Penicillium paradoxum]KAJ5793864.1 hypothetical protein N7457_000463 [Penicillium paradoxum]